MKIERQLILAAVLAAAGSALAACSSNALPALHPGTISNARAAATAGKLDAVAVRVFIPHRRHHDARAMRPFFVANSTRGIAVIVSVHGSSTPVSTTNASVASGSSLCKAVTGGRQCTITAGAPPGSDDFLIKTYDTAPAGGGFSGAKQLAIGSTTKTIGAGKKNSLSLTIGGVVAKAAVHLGWPVNPVIDKDVQTVTVSALDADGNTIINNGWYSATGAAVKIALSASNGVTGMFAFSPTSVTFAVPTTKLTYDSAKISSAQAQNGFTSTVSAKPDNGTTTGTATFTLSKPAFTEFPISSSVSGPEGITVGPDNALWFAESNVDKIGRITTGAAAGSNPTEYATGITSSASPRWLATGQDGLIWFTEFGIGKVASIDPSSHAVVEYVTPSGSADLPYGIVAGPDGNMWFTENCSAHSNVGKFNAAALDGGTGIIKEYPTASSNASPQMITAGADGSLWFTETAGTVNKIGKVTPGASPVPTDFSVGSTNTIYEGGITSGPDNALWFAECNPPGNAIGRMTTTGAAPSIYSLSTSSSSPIGIVTGPDGALWFAENGNNAIGRIDRTTHTIVEFTIPTGTADPFGITLGPDGALWFTENDGNKIGKLR